MSVLHKIYQWIRSIFIAIDRHIIIPFSQWIIKRLSRRTRARIRALHMLPEGMPEWKDKTLEDFRCWLDTLPEGPPSNDTVSPEACDLYTLLAEFSALRQEIKLQNRQQSKSIKTFTTFMDSYEGIVASFKEPADQYRQRMQDIRELENSIRQTVEKNTVRHFLDVRDALLRGRTAARAANHQTSSFFRKKTNHMHGIIEGYNMAIRRFDRALAAMDVYPVETLQRPFDPVTMKAVDTREEPGIENGIVIEEQLGGFTMHDEVLRTAEVVVSQSKD
jgi:molecular chaperone GrpE (heat shock protein)